MLTVSFCVFLVLTVISHNWAYIYPFGAPVKPIGQHMFTELVVHAPPNPRHLSTSFPLWGCILGHMTTEKFEACARQELP